MYFEQENVVLYGIVILVVYLIYSTCVSKENFSNDENILGEKILQFFKQPLHPFSDYLSVLTNNKNTSDNLISKGVYNKFKDNTNLTLVDIMNRF